jgi:hypothetical protein
MAATSQPVSVIAAVELNACVEALVAHYRVTGFPIYDLTEQQRVERFSSLMAFDHSTILKNGVVRQTMHGVSLCWHYQPHMWDIRCGAKRTPMEVFLDDDLLKRAIARRLTLGGYISDGGIRKAVSTFSGTQRVSTFRPTAAAAIYRDLLPAKGGSTWDFSGGFGGRLLGSVTSDRVKTYITTEPSTLTMEGLEEMASEWVPLSGRRISVELHRIGSEDFVPDRHSLDCIFSSPPYFSQEQYADEATQSFIKFPTRHQWLEGYLGGTLANCRVGLKPGGTLAVNIASVSSYPTLESDFLLLARREGWKLTSTLRMEMSKMVGTRMGRAAAQVQYKTEPVFLLIPR